MKPLEGRGIAVWVLLFVFAAAIVVAAATACSSEVTTSDDADQTDGGQMLDLTEADDGTDLTVDVGDTIRVTLGGNPTTGYEWASALSEGASTVLKPEGEPLYEQEEAPEDMVGVGGQFTFTFTAVAAGPAELKLKYWRQFEPDTAPIDTFTANITVK
jgi:inhibitor of cysteine peptidase